MMPVTGPPRADADDPRLAPAAWDPAAQPAKRWLVALLVLNIAAAGWYFGWLGQPERVGNPWLYCLLLVAELFNLGQAAGFWWTTVRSHRRGHLAWDGGIVDVDVFIPVYGEPVEIVEPTVAAATRLHGARVNVVLLDDGNSAQMRDLARRHGVRYLRRTLHTGAKAGNINHALGHTGAPFVLVLDCDHVPRPEFLERTLGHFADDRVAYVQTPQYYANAGRGGITAAAWAQQALFFGAIARGKDALGAMFCAGTNVVFRRAALVSAGGFPEGSLTEDFQLSVLLHERGWRSAYVPEVLALGLGPEDMASYVSQQLRWSRGCLSAIATVLRARLPLRTRVQYLLSSMYFLSGWTLLAYMMLPVVRILTGQQPLAGVGADQFLVHFAPYFGLALASVALAGAGSYTFAAYALMATTWWVHALSSLRALFRLPGRFVVTPKRGRSSWQPRAVAPSLIAVAVLSSVAAVALFRERSPAMLNNVAFAVVHVAILLCGASPALRYVRAARRAEDAAGGGVRAQRREPAGATRAS
jgi:cellulose synthase (UDP-forming)